MPALDIFNNDAFSVHSLTKAINETPYQPMLIGSMGLFSEEGITTTTLSIEKKGTTLSLVPSAARGAPGRPESNDKRTLIPINTVHLPQRGAVIADEVQNVRAFGSETELETVQNLVNNKLAKMRRNLDVTIEWQRIGAIKGQVLDADGTTVLLDLNTAFGTSAQTKDMVLDNDATKVKQKIVEATRLVETALGGVMHGGLMALCGTAFFDTLVGHPAVDKAYDRYLESQFLRTTQRGQEGTGPGFPFVGVQWMEYKGAVSGQTFVGDNDAYLVPMGVPDLFVTHYAPADYMETVNTVGLPYYAKQEMMRMNRGVELEAQSNPISICTRPNVIIKLSI
ncbi:MAG: major capsid protein [Limnohabitans sp.]